MCLGLAACHVRDAASTAAVLQTSLEQDWVEEVLLGRESGDVRNAVVRWATPVRFLLVAAPQRVQRAVEHAFSCLDEAIGDAHDLQLVQVAEDDPRIGKVGYVTIFAAAPRQAGALALQHGAQSPEPDADGWFTIVWNPRLELLRAVVFLDPELDEPWLRDTALEEMFQSLGPSNDSPRIQDSLLFESSKLVGCLDHLARVDRQVLRLLYCELKPGDKSEQILEAMQRVWDFGAVRRAWRS